MIYQVNTYIGERPVSSENIIIGQKVVYEVLNKYLRNKGTEQSQTQAKIS